MSGLPTGPVQSTALLGEAAYPGTARSCYAEPVGIPSTPTTPRWLTGRWVAEATLLAVATGLIRHISMQQNLWTDQGISPVWVKPGFSVAALLLLGINRSPGVFLGTLASMIIGGRTGQSVAFPGWLPLITGSVMKSAVDTALAILGAVLVRRLCAGRMPLYRLRDTVVFAVVLGIILPGLSVMIGLPTLLASGLVGGGRPRDMIVTWWLSELIGAWVVAPMMLAWADPREVVLLRRHWLHGIVIMTLLVLIGVFSFTPATRAVLSEGVVAALWLPMMAWAALALGQAGATLAAFIAMTMALGGALLGDAPFAADRLSLALINVQLFVASMAITAIFVGAVATERRRFQDALATHRDRLRRMTRELAGAEHRRQYALAQQLHDGLGQDLAIAKLRLDEVAQGEVDDPAAALQETMGFINRAVAVTRGITFELAPPSLGSLGLPAALRSLGEVIEQRDGLIFEYAQEGRDRRLPQELESLLYRSARELVTNVVKHAHATHVGVDLHLSPNRVALTVWDDGQGIAPARLANLGEGDPPGFGLYSLREAVDSLGGEVTIAPRAPGTTVRIDLNPEALPDPTGPGTPKGAAR